MTESRVEDMRDMDIEVFSFHLAPVGFVGVHEIRYGFAEKQYKRSWSNEQ